MFPCQRFALALTEEWPDMDQTAGMTDETWN